MLCILHSISTAAGLIFCKGKQHIALLPACNSVHHISRRNDISAIDINTPIRVNTCISASAAGCCNHCTTINHQPAIRVDTITLPSASIHKKLYFTIINRRYRNTVFIGVNPIIAGGNMDSASINGQVHFRIQSFIFCLNIQHPITLFFPIYIHGHLRIKGSIIFMKLFIVNHLCSILV